MTASELIAQLEDALRETTISAHDAGRVASAGRLHPTDDFRACPSMLCEDAVVLLVTAARYQSETGRTG